MKPRILIPVLVLASFHLSCIKEAGEIQNEEQIPITGEKITLIGRWENEECTRTSLQDDSTSIWWTTGEEINVFYGVHMQGKFVSTNTESAPTTQFEGSFQAVPGRTDNGTRNIMAVYPYNSENERAGTRSLNITIPHVQTAVKNGFSDKFFPAVAVSDDLDITFHNVCGGACFTVSSPGIESVTFTSFGGEFLSGKVQVQFDEDNGFPYVNYVFKGQQDVIVKAPEGESFEVGARYYAVLLPNTLSNGLSVKMQRYGESATLSLGKEIVVSRSRFGVLKNIDEGLAFTTDIPEDEIWYYTTDGQCIELNDESDLRLKIVSNTYENGKGVLKFKSQVTGVGGRYFLGCQTLSEMVLPNTVLSIGEFAFCDCENLHDIYLSSKLKSIRRNAFNRCTSLEKVSLPESLLEIDMYAFTSCRALKEISFPENISSIGHDAFSLCKSLTEVDLGKTSLTTLDDDTFGYCNNLKTVILPTSLQNLGFGVFEATGITELSLPEGFNGKVGTAAFQMCKNLQTISLGNANEIGEMAFNGCESLETLNIPETVDILGQSFISLCPSLRELTGKYVWDDHRSVVIDGTLIGYASGGLDNYSFVVPESITKIGEGVFSGNTNLENVIFHENVTSVGDYAFGLCSSLKNVSMGMVYEIGETLFMGCTSLEHVDISDNITTIPSGLFADCSSLKKMTIPAKVGWIGYHAFYGCSSLDSLFCVPIIPPSIDDASDINFGSVEDPEIFEGTPPTMKFLIGEDAINGYSASAYWNRFSSQFVSWQYPDRVDPDYYISTDYSKDGEVNQIMHATEGAGINVILMGDAFTDQNIDSGYYAETMRKAADALFSEEPYNSYRNLFNVYTVTVVSATEGYEHMGRALNTWFGNGTSVGGNRDAVLRYAKNAVDPENNVNTLIIVLMNREYYAGTCYMYYPSVSNGDYGRGLSIAYCPLGTSDEMLRQVVTHEAGGHGFAKLADEYNYSGTIPETEKNNYSSRFVYGWWKNIDFTFDPQEIKWSRFINDSLYEAEGIGVFEGACTYAHGAWRPTENSIMRHNTGGYNAPSRYAIWYRIHKLAYGDSWNGTYEDFVEYDAINRTPAAIQAKKRRAKLSDHELPPLAPPVIVEEP